MKEGQNLSYVTKMGAYGLAVAAAFAVALAVLVATSGTAEAEKPGDTVDITVADPSGPVQFDVLELSTGSSSFVANGAQSIVCNDAGKCDSGTEDADDKVDTPETDIADSVTVTLKIDADSGDGFIIVKRTDLLGSEGPEVTYTSINVARGQVAGSVSAKAATPTIKHDGNEETIITITVTDDSDDEEGIVGAKVTVVTTNGLLNAVDSADDGNDPDCDDVQACSTLTGGDVGSTDDDETGTVKVTLKGSNRAGSATVTVTVGDLTATADVTLAGPAKNLTAEAEQGSVEIGGKVFIVMTVTDAGGNPVKGAQPIATAKGHIDVPNEDDVPVDVDFDVDKDIKDTKNDIPACGDDDTDLDAGQLAKPPIRVMQLAEVERHQRRRPVRHPGGPRRARDRHGLRLDDSARGTHTIVLVAEHGRPGPRASTRFEVEIQVGGRAGRTSSTDAPARIDASAELDGDIIVTVLRRRERARWYHQRQGPQCRHGGRPDPGHTPAPRTRMASRTIADTETTSDGPCEVHVPRSVHRSGVRSSSSFGRRARSARSTAQRPIIIAEPVKRWKSRLLRLRA